MTTKQADRTSRSSRDSRSRVEREDQPSRPPGTTSQSSGLGVIVASVSAGVVAIGGGLFLFGPGSGMSSQESTAVAPQEEAMPTFDTEVERGAWLFESKGCVGCHGEAGAGGIVNENYVADVVPALDEMADRMMLYEPRDAEMVIRMIEEGKDPTSLTDDPPYPEYVRFVAQWGAVRTVIEEGAVAHKKDPNGPMPPLQMIAWKDMLTDEEISAILAYLISLYDWGELAEDPAPLEESGEVDG